jgi:hypothetical protein
LFPQLQLNISGRERRMVLLSARPAPTSWLAGGDGMMERTGMAKAILCQSLGIAVPLVAIYIPLQRLIAADWPAWVLSPVLVFGFWSVVWIGASLDDD